MSGIQGLSFGEHDNRQVVGKPAVQQPSFSGKSPQESAMELLDNKIGPAYKLSGILPEIVNTGTAKSEDNLSKTEIDQMKRSGEIECTTCKNRTYQDGSDDPGVSFKAPGHISPEASYAAVASHENEHVVNEQAKAHSENRQVISQSVQVFMATCPECGKSYASGGLTKTTTKGADSEQNLALSGENANSETKE